MLRCIPVVKRKKSCLILFLDILTLLISFWRWTPVFKDLEPSLVKSRIMEFFLQLLMTAELFLNQKQIDTNTELETGCFLGIHLFPSIPGHHVTVYTDHTAVEAILMHARWWTKMYGSGMKSIDVLFRSSRQGCAPVRRLQIRWPGHTHFANEYGAGSLSCKHYY